MTYLTEAGFVLLAAKEPWLKRHIESLSGLSVEDIQAVRDVAAIAASTATITIALFTITFGVIAWLVLRSDIRNDRDRHHLMISQVLLFPQKGLTFAQALAQKRFVLEIGTPPELPSLRKVFGSAVLEKEVGKQAAKLKCLGRRLFSPGSNNFLALQRLCVHLSGRDQDAIAAAMHGRIEDVHTDIDAVYLTYLCGEDGMIMPHALQVAEEFLPLFLDKTFRRRLVFHRQIHREYLPVLVMMAWQFRRAKVLFVPENVDTPEKERVAGREAAVWRVPIYTTQREKPALTRTAVSRRT